MLNKNQQIKKEVSTARPFLRWAGGKQKVVKYLLPFVPDRGGFATYYEPFLGGAALYFALQPKNAVLSDVNSDLINCYKHVAKNSEEISKLLIKYKKKDCSDFYYRVRALKSKSLSPVEQAARFIYLNKAAFNGIYRVNRRGEFNVPYGPNFGGIALPDDYKLSNAASLLKTANICNGDFEEILKKAKAGDFVYLDPPYPPRNNTSFFNHYSASRFEWDEQERVAEVYRKLSKRGCLVLLSNSGQKRVIELYNDFNISRLNVIRWLGSNGDRFRVHEIVVTNYNV